MRASLAACCLVGAATGFELSTSDMVRAHTARPQAGSKLLGSTKDGVFDAINAHMHAGGWSVADCEGHTHDRLREVEAAVLVHAAPVLGQLYDEKSDRRALRTATPPTPHAPGTDAYDTARDALCAHILQLWAHHIPTAARQALNSSGVVLPLMPQRHRQTSDEEYNAKASCATCHYSRLEGGEPRPQDPQVHAGAPAMPRWGGNSSLMHFNVEVNMTDISDSPQHPRWRFKYFYDARQKAARYDHLAGQADEVCAAGPPQGEPCTVLFANDGRGYLQWAEGCCALGMPLSYFGAVRSDWLFEGGSYYGQETVANRTTDVWFKQGASDNHYYVTTDARQLPVRYMEHKNGKLKQWDFDLATYNNIEQPAGYFNPPSGCKRC